MTQPSNSVSIALLYETKSKEDKDLNKVRAQVNSVLKTVLERCKKEKDSNRLLVPLEDYEERVCYYTAFSKTYMYNLFKEEELKDSKDNTVEIPSRILLLKCLESFYVQRKPFKYRDIYTVIKNMSQYFEKMTENEFRYKLHLLGFECKKTLNCGYIIIENPEIRYERVLYLKKIKHFRNTTAKTYYIDRMCVGRNKLFVNYNNENKNTSQSNDSEYTMYYMISKNCYEDGIFCYNDILKEDYRKWIMNIVASHLQPGSLVILNKANFNNQMCVNNAINAYQSKVDMIKWLQDHDIPCNVRMLKAELYELIKKYTEQSAYDIDRYIKTHGHEVVYLPPNIQQLSPTKLLWKRVVSDQNLLLNKSRTQLEMVQKLQKYLKSLPTSIWIDFENTIINQENELFSVDERMDAELDKYNMEIDNVNAPSSLICHYCEDRS